MCGFVFVLFSKIDQFGKNIIFLTLFLGISKENASEIFQRKKINSAELESLETLMFLEKSFLQTISLFHKHIDNSSSQKKNIRTINKNL